MLGKWFPKTTLILLCLAAAPLWAQSQSGSGQQTGDPVADAARKAREEKKNAQKPKKVYTDDDVARASAPQAQAQAASPGQAAQATGQQAATKAGAAAAAPEKEDPEKVWRKRFKDQHEKIARAERELEILQRESEKAQVQYYPDPQKALNEQNSRKDINDKNAKIAAKKQEIETLKQQLDDMEAELRRSGGDSGWARQ